MYIREAHPLDGAWPMGGGEAPIVEDPLTLGERIGVASACVAALDLGAIPAVVDGLDDAVSAAYHAYPDRLYLVGRDGRIAYQGGMGPFGFEPDQLAKAIRRELAE